LACGLTAALLVPLGAGTAPPVQAAGVFHPETFTLANGMQVVVIPNHRQPVVTHMVWYKVGAADEPEGRSGMAHLLEHLMFKGTANRAAGEFSQIVSRNGGDENAFTSHDFTAYYQNVAKDRLPLVMELEADRMRNLVLSDEQIATERQVVLEERHQRVDNDPGSLLSEQAQATQYLNHPYRRPVIGWEDEVRAISGDHLRAFYAERYAPNNAVLVVGGDVTAADVRPYAEKYYGALPACAVAGRQTIIEPPPIAARQVTLRDARVTQPAWSQSFLAPSHLAGAREHADALQVLAELLGGNATSRLYRRLVVDEAKAVSAGCHYDPTQRGPARFVIFASPRPGIDLDSIAQLVREEIGRVRAGEITSEEVERAKHRLRADAVYARDALTTGAYIFGEALAIGLPIEHVERWPDRIAAVSRDQVVAAARAVLDDQGAVTAQLLAGEPAATVTR
jgi:zinc protease